MYWNYRLLRLWQYIAKYGLWISVKYTLYYLTCGVLSSFCLKRGILSDLEGFRVRPLSVPPPNTLIVMQSNR